MHLTFSDPLILLMIPQSRLHYLLHFIIENETEEQRFRDSDSKMCARLQASKDQDWKLDSLPSEPLLLILLRDWLGNESNMQHYTQDAHIGVVEVSYPVPR